MAVSSPLKSNLSSVNSSLSPIPLQQSKTRANKWDPRPFNENPAAQQALNCISIRDFVRTDLLERDGVKSNTKKFFLVEDKDFDLLSDPVSLAESYDDMIQHHVATRVALFFQQAVVCYDTPFRYKIGDTEGQFFTAKKLNVKKKSGSELVISYQAAHSSTIPSLNACLRNGYERIRKEGKKPKYSAFLKDSHLEVLNNSTVGLPTFVNQIDTLIDGKTKKDNLLRSNTICLINKLAEGKISPCEATREFLTCFLTQLEKAPSRLKKKSPSKLKTIEIYKKKVVEMIDLATRSNVGEEENAFFDSLLSTNFSRAKRKDLPLVRALFYKRKFEVIRESECTETTIQNIISNRFPKVTTPAAKHEIKRCLIYQTKNDPDLSKTLQILFAISIESIEKDVKSPLNLTQKYKSDSKKYNNTLRDIRLVVRNYRKLENGFQAMLLRDFRVKLRNLNQKELSEKIDNLINKKIKKELAKRKPNHSKIMELRITPRSASTISRLENSRIHITKQFATPENQRRKDFTLSQLKIVCEALKVDYNYFICSFFASTSLTG